MGLTDAGAASGATDTTNLQFHNDVDVTFSMSGETNNGLAFGVSVDLDEAAGLGSTGNNGTAVYISSGATKFTLGNTDGALDFAMTEVTGAGSLTDNETSHDGFYGDFLDVQYDGQIGRLEYSMGDFAVAMSTEILDTDSAGRSSGYAVGAKYTTGGITFDVGYQTADSVDARFGGAAAVTAGPGAYIDDSAANAVVGTTGAAVDGSSFDADADTVLVAGANAAAATVAEVDATGVSVSGTFGAVTAGVAFTTYDSSVANFDADHTAIGLSYTIGDFTLGGNWGDFDSDTAAQDREGYGITANYALGGVAVVQAGYETSDVNGVDAGDTVSLGIAMSF